MRNNHPNVQNAINNGYDFNISDCLSRAWKLVINNFGLFVAFTAVYFFISLALGFIPFLGSIISLVITPALVIGFSVAAEAVKANKPLELNTFFKGFDKWVHLFVGALLIGLIALAFIIPFALIFGLGAYSTMSGEMADPSLWSSLGPTMIILSLALFLFFIALMAAFMWVPFLIYFHDYEGFEALKASYNIAKQKIGKHILLLILGIFIMLLGALALGFGLLVAIPVLYVLSYEIYCEITNKKDEKEMDILDHFTPMGESE